MNVAESGTFVSRGIILAAGDGDRMGDLTKQHPKVLLPINHSGDPIIAYPIKALAESGIKDIAVVVGYMAGKVKRELGDGSKYGVNLDYILNLDYSSGNAISAWKAKSWSKGKPVILCMGDHIIDQRVIQRLVGSRIVTNTLCIEYKPAQAHDIEEATKVALNNDGSIKDIGKGLNNWDALDTGVFVLTEIFFNAVEELISTRGIFIEMSDVINYMVSRKYRFDTCDVSDYFWMDIDFEEDLMLAQEIGVLNGHRL